MGLNKTHGISQCAICKYWQRDILRHKKQPWQIISNLIEADNAFIDFHLTMMKPFPILESECPTSCLSKRNRLIQESNHLKYLLLLIKELKEGPVAE
jgi:hypothetical protein